MSERVEQLTQQLRHLFTFLLQLVSLRHLFTLVFRHTRMQCLFASVHCSLVPRILLHSVADAHR